MYSYIFRRIALLVPSIFFITVIIFMLIRFIPGSAVDVIEASISQGGAVQIDRSAIEHALGLDVPVHKQYWQWITGILFHWDFGNSLIRGRPVLAMIVERMSVTLELCILALVIGTLISLPIGVFSAVRQDTINDYIWRTVAICMMAVPLFWVGTLIMIYPSVWWGWAPPMELISFSEDPWGNIKMFLLPAVIMGLSTTGMSMRLTRTTMLDVMRQDYIRTAWAKGLSEKFVITRHAVKNAFIPVVTMLGGGLGMLIGGSVIVEQIFVLPGIGQLMLQALNQRDYPVISGITLFLSIFVMACNLIVDISYTWLDPRIRYR